MLIDLLLGFLIGVMNTIVFLLAMGTWRSAVDHHEARETLDEILSEEDRS